MDYLLRIGDGLEKVVKVPMNKNIFEELITINNIMISKATNLYNFIKEVYPNISNIKIDLDYAIERTILIAKNDDVDVVNDKVLNKINANASQTFMKKNVFLLYFCCFIVIFVVIVIGYHCHFVIVIIIVSLSSCIIFIFDWQNKQTKKK